MKSELEVRSRIERLTGFSEALFVQSGTAALEVALRTLLPRRARVGIAALSCWTVPFAIHKMGHSPVFLDVDESWSAASWANAELDAVVAIDPWGSAGNWDRGDVPVAILDAAQAPGSSAGCRPVERFEAAILSFGHGKPISIGGGGAVLFREASALRSARSIVRFGVHDRRWADFVDRYTFCPALFPLLAQALGDAEAKLEEHCDEARSLRAEIAAAPIALRTSRPRSGTCGGLFGTLPLALPADYPLSRDDVLRAAIGRRFPLFFHPVSVPFKEPAWPEASAAHCPEAEDLSRRLVFLERSNGAFPVPIRTVSSFLTELAEAHESFRFPYSLPAIRRSLPQSVAHWARFGSVCRGPHDQWWVHDQSVDRIYSVTPTVAALVQREEIVRHA